MLRQMRERTKFVMLVVALAFVGLMVFEWGMDMSGRSSPVATGDVGSVNGVSISYQEWTRAYRNLSDQARQEKGGALTDRERDMVEEQTWSQLVNQILIEQELRRRGIQVTDEEVRMAFRSTPPPWLMDSELFQTDGEFDYEKYREFFSGPTVDPGLLQQIEAYYREVLPRSRLFEQISSGIYVSDSELWQIYRDRNERVRAEYLSLDPETLVPDSAVSVTEEELRRFYREHREDFEQPERARVRLASLSRVPGSADSAAALEQAQRIRDQIVEGGADFAEMAREHSADRASGDADGDLGWFGQGEMTPAFEEAAFDLDPGEISEPVATRFGYHLIKVTEREEERVRASHILIPIELSGESENELLGRVDRLEDLALRAGLEVAADSAGVSLQEITLAEGSNFVPGIGQFGTPLDWAFHDSTFVGDLSPMYETAEGFFVFELVERQPEGVVSFEEARPGIRRRVLQEKKLEAARSVANELANALRAGASLQEVASDRGLELQTTGLFSRSDFVPDLGQANPAIGAAFGLETGEVAGPVEANGRLFFLKPVERQDADREAFNQQKEQVRAQLTLQRRQSALERWLAELREEADIVDQRREFFQPRT